MLFCKYCCPIYRCMSDNPKWGKQPPSTPGNKKQLQEKPLEKPIAIVNMFHEDSCSLIYYTNKMYEYVAHGMPAVSWTTTTWTIPLTYNNTKLNLINTTGNNLSQHKHKNSTLNIHKLTTLRMSPSKSDILHIHYGFTSRARGKLVTQERWIW